MSKPLYTFNVYYVISIMSDKNNIHYIGEESLLMDRYVSNTSSSSSKLDISSLSIKTSSSSSSYDDKSIINTDDSTISKKKLRKQTSLPTPLERIKITQRRNLLSPNNINNKTMEDNITTTTTPEHINSNSHHFQSILKKEVSSSKRRREHELRLFEERLIKSIQITETLKLYIDTRIDKAIHALLLQIPLLAFIKLNTPINDVIIQKTWGISNNGGGGGSGNYGIHKDNNTSMKKIVNYSSILDENHRHHTKPNNIFMTGSTSHTINSTGKIIYIHDYTEWLKYYDIEYLSDAISIDEKQFSVDMFHHQREYSEISSIFLYLKNLKPPLTYIIARYHIAFKRKYIEFIQDTNDDNDEQVKKKNDTTTADIPFIDKFILNMTRMRDVGYYYLIIIDLALTKPHSMKKE